LGNTGSGSFISQRGPVRDLPAPDHGYFTQLPPPFTCRSNTVAKVQAATARRTTAIFVKEAKRSRRRTAYDKTHYVNQDGLSTVTLQDTTATFTSLPASTLVAASRMSGSAPGSNGIESSRMSKGNLSARRSHPRRPVLVRLS